MFRNLSIRRKLNLLIGGTAAGAVLLVGLLLPVPLRSTG